MKQSHEDIIVKTIRVTLYILSILLFAAPILFYIRESTNGMLHELSWLRPEEWAAAAFNLSMLLMVGFSSRRPGDRLGLYDPPDVSPGEMCAWLKGLIVLVGVRIIDHLFGPAKTPVKQPKHRRSEIV